MDEPSLDSASPPRRRALHVIQGRSLRYKHMTLQTTAQGRALYPDEGERRPPTRGGCASASGPCPYVSCRHHLALEVRPTGTITWALGQREVDELPETCSLQVAERGGLSRRAVSLLLGISRERVRQIENAALRKVRQAMRQEISSPPASRSPRPSGTSTLISHGRSAPG